MQLRYLTRTILLAGAAGLLIGANAAAQTKGPREAFYRCRDSHGQSHFGQSIPEECMNLEVEVLDSSGRVVRKIEGFKSVAERKQEQAAAEAKVRDAQAAAQRDRTLLATYLTVSDIERLRDQRVEQLEQQAHLTQQYIANLREREARLVADVQRFRPYSNDTGAPPLPEHLGEEIVNTVNGLQVYEQELAKNTSEQTRLSSEFASDIARFKELKGIK